MFPTYNLKQGSSHTKPKHIPNNLELEKKWGKDTGLSPEILQKLQEAGGESDHPVEKQLFYLKRQEVELFNSQTAKLTREVQALHAEVAELAKVTDNLSAEEKNQAFLDPPEANVYELTILKRLRELIFKARTNVAKASHWIEASNNRRKKRNFWGRFKDKKQGGSQLLLSGETYLTRSAG